MKTISKYTSKKFAFYFIAIFIIIFIFVAVINLFETANMLTRKGEEFTIKTVIFQTPYYVYLITPLITMLSAFMTFNYFVSNNEYKAIYASGYSKTVFLYPLMVSSFVVILFSLLIQDKFATRLYRETSIKNQSNNFSNLYIKKGVLILAAKEVLNSNIIKDVYIEDTGRNKSIKTDYLKWDNATKIWTAHKGILKEGIFNIKTSSFNELTVNFLPPPEEIIIKKISDGNIYGIWELIQRIRKLKSLSMKTIDESVFVFFKLSLILINLLSVIIAFIIAQTDLIKNRSVSASLAIIISFVIWFIIIATKRAADIEIIRPCMVIVLPHSIFFLSSIYIIYRKKMI